MLKKIKRYFKTPKGFGQLVNLIAIFSPYKAGKLAFKVFCTPRKGRNYTSNQERFLAKAKQERLPLHDFEIQTYRWEKGPKKILLAHGWDSNATRWKALISLLLAKNYTVIAFDAPAHGKSGSKIINGVLYAEAMQQVMNRFQAEYVVGHSFGGMSAVYYFSDLVALPVKRLILMGTPSLLSRVLADYYKLIGFKERGQKAISKLFERDFGFNVDYFSAEELIKKVNLPGFVIHDKQDAIAPFSEAVSIHKNWENSVFFETDGIGHSMQVRDVYYKIIDAIEQF